jgi:hypothetical protein
MEAIEHAFLNEKVTRVASVKATHHSNIFGERFKCPTITVSTGQLGPVEMIIRFTRMMVED